VREVEPVVNRQSNVVRDKGEKANLVFREAIVLCSCEAQGSQATGPFGQRKHTKRLISLVVEESKEAREPDILVERRKNNGLRGLGQQLTNLILQLRCLEFRIDCGPHAVYRIPGEAIYISMKQYGGIRRDDGAELDR
jgi:hypothetical protein